MKQRLPQIGRSMPRSDAEAKVRGLELYATDIYPDNFLWIGARLSDRASALIKAVRTEAARALPGVTGVLTAADVPGTNMLGIMEADQPIIAGDRVCCASDTVALVLAEDREILARALKSISVDYEELPGVYDPEEALKEEAPLVRPGRAGRNLLFGSQVLRGSMPDAFAECPFVVEEYFRTPWQEHAYLETENGTAFVDEHGCLQMWVSTQTPFRDRIELAVALGMPMDKIRIRAPYLGGGFGGKDGITVQGLLAVAALHSGGRPVKIWNSREDSIQSSTKRHPARLHYRLGALEDGTLHALEASALFDTGAYAALGEFVLALCIEHMAGVYRIPNTRLVGQAALTNNPVASAFRGFGVPQALAAMEQMIDMLAAKMGRDPLELRLQNAVASGDELGSGTLISNSAGMRECLSAIQNHSAWMDREEWEKAAAPFKRRAVGLAAGLHGMGYGPEVPDRAGARIELLEDGRFRIYCGIADMGQGNNPTNIHVAGALLGQPAQSLELVQPDTARCLPSGSSSASRTTFTYVQALIGACRQMRENLIRKACELNPGSLETEMDLLPGRVCHVPSGLDISLATLAGRMNQDERMVSDGFVATVAGHIPDIEERLRKAGMPHRVFSFSAHLVRIEIDEITGLVAVCDYIAATDGGQVINPLAYEQQIHGGIAQGIGMALMEDFQVEKGLIKTGNLASYMIPGALDIPDLESIAVYTFEEDGPFGMKGIGEISVNLPLPAISNALARALGKRITTYPIGPEQVLEILKAEGEGGGWQ